MEELREIGYTKKTYGYQGELKIFIEDHFLDYFLEAKVLFVEKGGQRVPYFVKEIREYPQLLLILEEVDTKETAKPLTNKKLFMRAKDLPESPNIKLDELAYLQQFIGFTIIDQLAGEVGVIEEIIEMPQQFLAVTPYRGKEALIPINEHFLSGVDKERKILEMDLPEGLLEVF